MLCKNILSFIMLLTLVVILSGCATKVAEEFSCYPNEYRLYRCIQHSIGGELTKKQMDQHIKDLDNSTVPEKINYATNKLQVVWDIAKFAGSFFYDSFNGIRYCSDVKFLKNLDEVGNRLIAITAYQDEHNKELPPCGFLDNNTNFMQYYTAGEKNEKVAKAVKAIVTDLKNQAEEHRRRESAWERKLKIQMMTDLDWALEEIKYQEKVEQRWREIAEKNRKIEEEREKRKREYEEQEKQKLKEYYAMIPIWRKVTLMQGAVDRQLRHIKEYDTYEMKRLYEKGIISKEDFDKIMEIKRELKEYIKNMKFDELYKD